MKKRMAHIIVPFALLVLFQLPIEASDDIIITYADGRSSGGIRQGADSEDGRDSPGDIFVFDQKLLAKDTKTVIGRNAGYCIRTDPGAPDFSSTDHPTLLDDPDNNYGQCTWTLTFFNHSRYTGSITVSGREADLGASQVAIIGGTGDFIGATGMLTSTPIPQGENGVLFRQVLSVMRVKNDDD